MSDVANLSTVNLDILLEVVKHGLQVRDVFNLRATCKSLHSFTNRRSPWIVLLERLSSLRPLPLPPYRKLITLSLDELIAIAVKTTNLTQNWSLASPEARPAFRMVAFPLSDIIVSILVIPHTPYVLTLSVGSGVRSVSWITCVDTDKGRRVARYRSDGLVSSWRAETIADTVIVIALLIGPEDRSKISPELPAHYNVLRLGLPNQSSFTPASFHGISSHLITSPITGMFLTTEVAGLVSVIRASQTSGLLMTRFKDATTAYIDSGVPVHMKSSNLNTIANQADLILYTEDNNGASAYAYSFADDLLPLFAPSPPHAPQRLIRLAPTTIQSYKFHPSELCDGSNIAYTIIRTRWKDLAAARLPPGKPGHSEISVLSMAFVLGADETGAHDHRCISHMYLDPFRRPQDQQQDEAESVTCCSCSTSPSRAGSDRGTPDIVMHPHFTTSSALAAQTPSPTIIPQALMCDTDDTDTPKKPDDPIVRRTFHSCLEEKKEIWQGPSRNDLISVGLGASHAIWLAAGEHRETPPVLKLASFEEPSMSLPLRAAVPPTATAAATGDAAILVDQDHVGPRPPRAIRTLKLPLSIHPHEISALALDDANGVIALATTRSELWLLDYAISPASLRGAEYA